MSQDPQIIQIVPADGTRALFGRREIDDQRGVQQCVTNRLPVICWALVADSEVYVMGMVAAECGEIALVSQWDDFLGYETPQNFAGRSSAPRKIIPARTGAYKTAITTRGVKVPEMYLLSPNTIIHSGEIVDVIVSDRDIQVYDAVGQLVESFDFSLKFDLKR